MYLQSQVSELRSQVPVCCIWLNQGQQVGNSPLTSFILCAETPGCCAISTIWRWKDHSWKRRGSVSYYTTGCSRRSL